MERFLDGNLFEDFLPLAVLTEMLKVGNLLIVTSHSTVLNHHTG